MSRNVFLVGLMVNFGFLSVVFAKVVRIGRAIEKMKESDMPPELLDS